MSESAPPVRVLWLIKGLGPGGAEQLLVNQASKLDASAVRVDTAYLLGFKHHLVSALEAHGVPAIWLRGDHPADPRWLRRLRTLMLDEHYDVVHVHSPMVAALTRLIIATLPRQRRPALVSTEHNRWPRHHPATRVLNALTLLADDKVFAVSDDVVSTMPAILARRTEVLIHGIDQDALQPSPQTRAEQRSALGITDDEVVVGIVANFREAKAYEVWIDAACLAISQEPSLRFVSVGQGPLEAAMRDRVERSGLGDRISLLGYRADATEVMQAFDIFSLSSRHEGLPVALMEALSLGLAVVSTNAGGIPQAVTDGTEAVLVGIDDPAALADALVSVARDPDRRAALGRAARRRAAAFDISRAAERLSDCYVTLSEPARRG